MNCGNYSDYLKSISTSTCRQYKTKLKYYPSNSKKGIVIKGTNLRVELIHY